MVSTREVPERRVRIPSITSQKGERSIGTVSSAVVQESPTVSTREVPDRRTPETPSTRCHATSSRTASTVRSSAQDIVSSKPASTLRQIRQTYRARRKRPGQ